MGYYIDLEKVTIEEYKAKLESAYLPPSRMMLKDKLDEQFGYLKGIGLNNIKELIQLLQKKKNKFAELSNVDCFSHDYLTILLRELNSTIPKSTKIADFTGISKDTVNKLEKIGINNTEKLYGKVIKELDKQKLADLTGINYSDILNLVYQLSEANSTKFLALLSPSQFRYYRH